MPLNVPNLDKDSASRIERFVRDPLEWPLRLQGFTTADLPTAADYPNGLLFDTTLDRPTASDGANWEPVALSSDLGTAAVQPYVEGTWTPVLTFGGGSTGLTYAASGQLGRYTKIGRLVYIEMRLILSAKGSSTGNASIGGLPFTVNASIEGTGKASLNGMSGLSDPVMIADRSGTSLVPRNNNTGSRSAITETSFTNSTDIELSMTYSV